MSQYKPTHESELSPLIQKVKTVFTFMLYKDTFLNRNIKSTPKNTLTNKHTYFLLIGLPDPYYLLKS